MLKEKSVDIIRASEIEPKKELGVISEKEGAIMGKNFIMLKIPAK